jgi:hypothetical protein
MCRLSEGVSVLSRGKNGAGMVLMAFDRDRSPPGSEQERLEPADEAEE